MTPLLPFDTQNDDDSSPGIPKKGRLFNRDFNKDKVKEVEKQVEKEKEVMNPKPFPMVDDIYDSKILTDPNHKLSSLDVASLHY